MIRPRTLLAAATVLLGLAAAPPASAALIALTASLDCAQAEFGTGTCDAGGSGTGSAALVLDDVSNELSWVISWSGLSSLATLAHFHGPALPSENGLVQINIGVGSNPAIGNATLTDDQEADLLAGLWYVNVHSVDFVPGEIRGQISVPEPAALGLVASIAAFAAATRRRAAR